LDEVDEGAFGLTVKGGGDEGEVIENAVALKFIVEDGESAPLKGADADAGGLQLRSGKEHEFAEAGAQVAFGCNLSGRLGIHHSHFISRMGKVGEGLAWAVNGG
jgi:hypothetical protein